MVTENYKETELGRVPIDWDVIPIDEGFDFHPNNTYARNCMNDQDGEILNIHYGDVLIKYGSILDCEKINIPFLNSVIKVNTDSRTVQSGDIIIADTAEDNSVGKATEIINVGNKIVLSGLHTIFMRPHCGLFTKKFLGFFMNASIYHNQLLPYIVGTKVSSISKKVIKKTLVLRPGLEEQRNIATVLSEVDNLIETTEKLIAKKRAIKKGAMQELLSGKKRLKGFTNEWVKTQMNNVSNILNGDRSKNYPSPSDFISKGVPFINAGHLKLTHIDFSTMDYISTEKYNSMGGAKLQRGDILICLRGSLGKYAMAEFNQGGLASSLALIRTDSKKLLNRYLFQLVGSNIFEKMIEEENNGSSQPNLPAKSINNLRLMLPSIAEQEAIANILFEMDSELNILQKKLLKYRKIKQGMMSELLTGRIRLIDEEVS